MTPRDDDFIRNPPPGPAHDDGERQSPHEDPNRGDDIPDTPPTEPAPQPVKDPRPAGQPRGPYVVRSDS